MPDVAAIILAAGASTRLGTPKQSVHLAAETLLERTARLAHEAGLNPILGVLSPALTSVPTPQGMLRVLNHQAAEGIASSIRTGIEALAAATANPSGAILLACDQPAVTAQHLRELALGANEPVASSYAGRKGIPAYFPATLFAELLTLRGDQGARPFLQHARAIPLPGGEQDIDTIEDLEQARALYDGR